MSALRKTHFVSGGLISQLHGTLHGALHPMQDCQHFIKCVSAASIITSQKKTFSTHKNCILNQSRSKLQNLSSNQDVPSFVSIHKPIKRQFSSSKVIMKQGQISKGDKGVRFTSTTSRTKLLQKRMSADALPQVGLCNYFQLSRKVIFLLISFRMHHLLNR